MNDTNKNAVAKIDDLDRNWSYQAEPLSVRCYTRYWLRILRARPAPNTTTIKPVTKQNRWVVYFVHAPDGTLQSHHHYTLNQLRQQGLQVFVVVATPSPDDVPRELPNLCDALSWKALGGYDFSAYTIALNTIAHDSPGADVLVFNDSVYGPFCDLTPYFDHAKWDLTGFTATDRDMQRHIQSYAFILKNVTPARMDTLNWILSRNFAFNSALGAIACQELWFARVASRSMSVGAFWFGDEVTANDPSLVKAIDLLRVGFPFLKRSLRSKHDYFGLSNAATDELKRLGHPL